MRFAGLLYRALNPAYAREPLSGQGAALFGGRFNRKGREALYTSLAPDVALREANQVGTLQPTTLLAYRADVRPLVDGRSSDLFAQYGLRTADLADPSWRDLMLRGKPVPTQDLAETLIKEGIAGMFVPSYARGAAAGSVNLVLWRWHGMLEPIDDDDRLGIKAR